MERYNENDASKIVHLLYQNFYLLILKRKCQKIVFEVLLKSCSSHPARLFGLMRTTDQEMSTSGFILAYFLLRPKSTTLLPWFCY
ncbi:MAG TPA: hypothetical protein DCR40_04395 [Prolixibacteraceae bacterium]|nr:hypothetical protein [Prolixibacteraceae bacterium]